MEDCIAFTREGRKNNNRAAGWFTIEEVPGVETPSVELEVTELSPGLQVRVAVLRVYAANGKEEEVTSTVIEGAGNVQLELSTHTKRCPG